jgi:glutamine synthetase
LPNAKTTPDALEYFLKDDVKAAFEKYKIFSKRELESKVEIKLESYTKIKEIEYKYAIKMINTLILPAILKQIGKSAKTLKNLGKLNIASESINADLKTLVDIYEEVKGISANLEKFLSEEHGEVLETAKKYASEGANLLSGLRSKVDVAEDLVADEYWPLASYQKLLNAF